MIPYFSKFRSILLLKTLKDGKNLKTIMDLMNYWADPDYPAFPQPLVHNDKFICTKMESGSNYMASTSSSLIPSWFYRSSSESPYKNSLILNTGEVYTFPRDVIPTLVQQLGNYTIANFSTLDRGSELAVNLSSERKARTELYSEITPILVNSRLYFLVSENISQYNIVDGETGKKLLEKSFFNNRHTRKPYFDKNYIIVPFKTKNQENIYNYQYSICDINGKILYVESPDYKESFKVYNDIVCINSKSSIPGYKLLSNTGKILDLTREGYLKIIPADYTQYKTIGSDVYKLQLLMVKNDEKRVDHIYTNIETGDFFNQSMVEAEIG